MIYNRTIDICKDYIRLVYLSMMVVIYDSKNVQQSLKIKA